MKFCVVILVISCLLSTESKKKKTQKKKISQSTSSHAYVTAEEIAKRKNEISAKMAQVKGVEDFFRVFGITNVKVTKTAQPLNISSLSERFVLSHPDGTGMLDSGGNKMEMRNCECEPRLTLVDLPKPNGIYLYPECAEVPRCSGSCNSLFPLTCHQVRQKAVDIPIIAINYKAGNYPDVEQDVVSVMEDISCACSCSNVCNEYQTLSRSHCTCSCNHDNYHCPERKQWSNISCDCVCSDHAKTCDVGRKWSNESCQCEFAR